MPKEAYEPDFSLALTKGLHARFVCCCGGQVFEEETVEYVDGRYHRGCGERIACETPF